MKSKAIPCLTLILSFSADAAERTPEAVLRDNLNSVTSPHHPPLKTWDPAWGDPPPPPPPRNIYDDFVRWMAEQHGIPKSDVDAAILARAEDYHSRMKPGAEPLEQSPGPWYRNLLNLMRHSGDRAFLPAIEKAGTEPADWNVRVAAVQTHVALCGFDSFPFVKRAVAAAESLDTERVRNGRYYIVDAFLNPRWESPPMSEGHIAEVCRWLLEQIGTVNDILLLELYDGYLLKHLPEYAHSRQRLALASREDLDEIDYGGNRRENVFIAAKAEIEAIPPSERTDLRIRYPGLPPLPDDLAEASASAARRAWLIAAVGVAAALALAVLALLRRAKKAGAA